jgi:hypothetical protein
LRSNSPQKVLAVIGNGITIHGLWFGTKEWKVYVETRSAKPHLESWTR